MYEEKSITWPIPMIYQVELLKFLAEAKPKVVAYDFHLAKWFEADKVIEELCEVSKKLPHIVWGREIDRDNISLQTLPYCFPNGNELVFFDVFKSGPQITEYRKYSRFFLGYWWALKNKYKTLSLATVNKFQNEDLSLNSFFEKKLFINFSGPKNTYTAYKFSDILNKKILREKFRDKIVLIGVDDNFNSQFYLRTPYHKEGAGKFSMSRTEIHANIIDTILNKTYIIFCKPEVTKIITILVSTFTCAIVFTTAPMAGVIFLVCEFIFLLLLAVISIKFFYYYINLFEPLLSIFISYYIFIPYRLIKEYKARWKVEEEVKIINKVEELKNNFMGLMTHDLKTPIARIRGLAEVIIAENVLKDTHRNHLENIVKSADEFTSFINKILNFLKIESSGVTLNIQNKDINNVIEKSIGMLEYDASSKNILIEKNLEPLFPINIDPDLIQQVLKNLIENAIKYSKPDTKVLITSFEKDEKVFIKIKDEGVGIPETERENIFLKFYRIKDDRLSMAKGTGLGLFLVKYFIELHKGKISVDSSPNQGTEFTIELPGN